MALRFYNSLTGRKEEFSPSRPDFVAIYSCGPTVYDYAHIGNFRAFLFVDLLRRHLLFRGYSLKQAINLTDVEDKIIQRAAERGMPIDQYTAPFIEAFLEDLDFLRVLAPEHRPRATEHIPAMLEMIAELQRRQHAYVADGSVYFRLATFSEYGRLSRIDPEQLRAAADGRFDADEYTKEDLRDFALWKAASADDAAAWASPWGRGRPGWHIECSAMIQDLFGPQGVDIHTGGIDLLFPHHENEIAQSRCSHPEGAFVRYWLHNEHLLVDGRKMSKSAGNFYAMVDFRDAKRIKDLLGRGAPEELLRIYERGNLGVAIRYLLLATHYRQKLNFTFDGLLAAEQAILRLRRAAERLSEICGESAAVPEQTTSPWSALSAESLRLFGDALDDDLNISRALAAVFDFVRELNILLESQRPDAGQAAAALNFLVEADRTLDLLRADPPIPGSSASADQKQRERIEALIADRQLARAARNFTQADAIRLQLDQMGVAIKDTPAGVVWQWK
ncbi:MAG: cysteine--tRNA ligase [Leptospirales bacterium]|nr:cysteine--tRNA ligase [Leptospirales bacterium]